MGLLGNLKLALQARGLWRAIEKENGMDWGRLLLKMGKDVLNTSAGLAAFAVIGYYTDADHLQKLLANLPGPVAVAALPLASAALVGLQNWLKHGKTDS